MIRNLILGFLLAVFTYADARTTRDVVTHGGREMNPILRPIVMHRQLFYAVEFTGSGLSLRYRPVAIGIIAGHAFGYISNREQIRKHKRSGASITPVP